MKRSLLVLVSLLAIVAMLFTTAAATPPSVKLVTSRFVPGKGVVFIFEVKGLEHKEMKGWVNYSGKEFSMDCNTGDANTVSCVVSDGISQFEGKAVSGVLAGLGFSATVPVKRTACSWSFVTDAGWYYIFDNATVGASVVSDAYGETVIPDTISCVKDSWGPNQFWFPGQTWYEIYVGP
jgi:hypothetical protein